METTKLIKALRHMGVQTGGLMCVGCKHENGCSLHGCAVIRAAADTIEELNNFLDSQCARLMIENQKLQQELQAEKCRIGSEWLDPEIEVPPDDGAVLGLVNGVIDGIEHRNAYHLVCYDCGKWWLFDRPSIDANVYRWMPLPEPPEKELYG